MIVLLLVLGERKQPGDSQHGTTVCIYKTYQCLFCSNMYVHLVDAHYCTENAKCLQFLYQFIICDPGAQNQS